MPIHQKRPEIPEFEIMVDAQGRPRFAHPRQGYAWCKQYAGQLIAGQFYPMGEKRSQRQNSAFHAMLTPWLKEGQRIEDLKSDLLGHVFGYLEVVSTITGEVRKVLAEPHTSTLTRRQFCELIDQTLELAAESGVWLQAPDEYRRAKDAAEKQAARAARKQQAA